ncbi:hypothetical protein HMPREF9261_1800 [Finegoldia magna ACS-171-V-Col3]|uniref:hypothetical protein n=1 Tax=Finegoldia magna TaxID=1260 RepID=UPI0001DE517D|nr:hypothetical protein [Finegoldia magna]EFK94285.1 hypothetical protein HMPREF9261_1800 [Finegoldia magna ACS-171-V-Col3]
MSYDGKINRKLRTVKLKDDECLYKLAYDEEKRSCFTREYILKYVNKHYLENDNIIEENLLNDLNTFKTYRDDVDSLVGNQSSFSDYLAMFIAVLGIVYDIIEDSKAMKYFVLVVVLISFVIFVFNLCSTGNKSESAKLKYITNAIYTLEAIKEDMYRNGNSSTESDEIISSVNDKQDDGNSCTESDEIISSVSDRSDDVNTEDITTEDSDERYEGLELTEVKEIRTYTYKATGNKYSPRAMYERKRR